MPRENQMRAYKKHSGGVILVLLFVLPLVLIGSYFLFPTFFSTHLTFLEKNPPTIEFMNPPSAIGLEPTQLQFKLADQGAGIDEVVIRIEQAKQHPEVFKKEYKSEKKNEDLLSVEMKAKDLGLREGPAKLEASIFDKSFWSNRTEVSWELRVLYSKPRVEVLTAMHNVAQGGAGLLFYRHLAGEIRKSGVKVGDLFFKGYPAELLDTQFKNWPNVYFSFFAVPKNFDGVTQKITVEASDVAGNQAIAPVNYLILRRKFREADMQLTPEFLQRKLPDLLPGYFQLAGLPQKKIDVPQLSAQEQIDAFRAINERYRSLLAGVLAPVFAKSEGHRYWQDAFVRPVAGSPTSVFGENRQYALDGESAGSSTHDGIDLAATANTLVRPASAGKVIFADDLGIYGTTIIIDHGFGLTSLYGHLSSISVTAGAEVSPETVIGRSGATGLAGGDHLHFEIRLGGLSITPIEWWDKKWVNDHIEDCIRKVLEQVKQLG